MPLKPVEVQTVYAVSLQMFVTLQTFERAPDVALKTTVMLFQFGDYHGHRIVTFEVYVLVRCCNSVNFMASQVSVQSVELASLYPLCACNDCKQNDASLKHDHSVSEAARRDGPSVSCQVRGSKLNRAWYFLWFCSVLPSQ